MPAVQSENILHRNYGQTRFRGVSGFHKFLGDFFRRLFGSAFQFRYYGQDLVAFLKGVVQFESQNRRELHPHFATYHALERAGLCRGG